MGKIVFSHNYEDIISLENLLEAWREFLRGKRKKKDVQEFQLHLMDNLLDLYADLRNKTYTHGAYRAFNISDPKPRSIHKATVRDRVLHHLLYSTLYPFFDKIFIADSYSCQIGKGTHKALTRFTSFHRKVSENHTRTCWILKCDIRKFFANIDHEVLLLIVAERIADINIIWLIARIVHSFCSGQKGKGLPLGNLTSQLLVNIYMNEFDQFVKHKLKAKYYIRYADDFVIMSSDKTSLERILPEIGGFLRIRLKLELHPDKVYIKTVASGLDFLGWVHFPDHKVLRTTTKRRMLKKLKGKARKETIQSYLGLLKHGNTFKLEKEIRVLTDRQSLPSG